MARMASRKGNAKVTQQIHYTKPSSKPHCRLTCRHVRIHGWLAILLAIKIISLTKRGHQGATLPLKQASGILKTKGDLCRQPGCKINAILCISQTADDDVLPGISRERCDGTPCRADWNSSAATPVSALLRTPAIKALTSRFLGSCHDVQVRRRIRTPSMRTGGCLRETTAQTPDPRPCAKGVCAGRRCRHGEWSI